MRINPRTIETDIMDRATIRRALETEAAATARALARKRDAYARRYTRRIEAEIESLETHAARIADLLNTFSEDR